MKIYDISQELFNCIVYPGDPKPEREQVMWVKNGDVCNLSKVSMCAHNGTHVDSPYHFYADGKTIEQIDLSKFIGEAWVVSCEGEPNLVWLEDVLKNAPKKILFKGNVIVTLDAAKLLNQYEIELVGVESQSVGPVNAPKEVHLELLGKEVVLLEGIRLGDVPEGKYLLNAAPINFGGADGAPCRAVLLEM